MQQEGGQRLGAPGAFACSSGVAVVHMRVRCTDLTDWDAADVDLGWLLKCMYALCWRSLWSAIVEICNWYSCQMLAQPM